MLSDKSSNLKFLIWHFPVNLMRDNRYIGMQVFTRPLLPTLKLSVIIYVSKNVDGHNQDLKPELEFDNT